MKNYELTTEEIDEMIENIDVSGIFENEEELFYDDIFTQDDLENYEDDLPELTMEDVFGCPDIVSDEISDDFFTPCNNSLLTKTELWNNLIEEVDNSDLLVYVLAETVTNMCGRPFSVRHIIDSVYYDGRNGFEYDDVSSAVLAVDEFFNIWCNSHLADFNMRSDSLKTISYIFKNMPEYQW